MRIDGARAVVTGGASGIGRGIVQALVKRGCRVVLADIDEGRASAAAAELGQGVIGAVCDVRDLASVQALADTVDAELGGVDLAFANAGVSVTGPVLNSTVEELDWIFDVNVRGVWNTLTVFGLRMREQGGDGHLCITGSEHSLGFVHANAGLYTATKHAVVGLADVMRNELPPGIGVSVLCPGLVSSELHLSRRTGPLPLGDAAAVARGSAIMAQGMDPGEVGRAAVEGVERGDFFIVTHPTSRAAPTRRNAELQAAFDAQAPWTDDASRYDVEKIMSSLSPSKAS